MASALIDVLRLTRVHSGAATAAVPALAAIIAGGNALQVALVIAASLAHHAWGFSFNEINDIEVDRRSGLHGDKPLVSGNISLLAAWTVSAISLVISFTAMAIAPLIGSVTPLVSIGALCISTGFGSLYDVFGKRFPLSDIFVALWYGFRIYAGGAAVSGDISMPLVIGAAVVGGGHILFNNMIEGGMKDIEGDRACGVRSFANITGNRYLYGQMRLTAPFLATAIFLRGSFAAMLCVLAYLVSSEHGQQWHVLAACVLSIALFAHSLTFLKPRSRIDRGSLLRTFSIHEIASFALSVFVIFPAVGIVAASAAVLLPIAWFAALNRMMFGTGMTPKV